jgi:DnaJ-class molecular chaperone
MTVTDKMTNAAYNTFLAAINDTTPCERCSQRGYHHGFGEDGCDPDWCETCGGSGFVPAHDEKTAMKMAVEAALAEQKT